MIDMSAEGITERLRHVARVSDLRPEHRLDGKVDMSSAGIVSRLREVSDLNALARALGEIGHSALASVPPGL